MFIAEYLTQRKDFKSDITENTDHRNTSKSIAVKIVAIIINIARKNSKMQNKKGTKFNLNSNLNLVKFQLALSQFAKTLSDTLPIYQYFN